MNLRLLTQCETLPKIFKIQLQHHSSFDVISVICMLKKSCWKVVTKPWIDGFMDWIEWPAQQMTEEAKVWIDHHRRSMIESRWIFDQLSWHNQLQYLMINRSWWQIIFWARLLPSPFLRHSFVFSFIRFNSDEKKRLPSKFLGKTQFNLLPFKNTSLPRNLHFWKLGTVQSRI